MALKAGQEIDAFCTKCKMDLLHRIVAVANDKPVKVECRTCKTVHVYRAPKSAPAARAAAPASSGRATTSTARAASSRRGAAPEPPPRPAPGTKVFPYTIFDRFGRDQYIQHKTFGVGVVVQEIGQDKIEVRFEDGNKVLVHNRTE